MTRVNKPPDDFGGSADFFNEQASELIKEVHNPWSIRINVDVVLVLDLTSSMEKLVQWIRQQGIAFVDQIFDQYRFRLERNRPDHKMGRTRARIVAFRDYDGNRKNAIARTRFFDLENEVDRGKLDRVLSKLSCDGRSEKRSALEAIHYAINSQWDRDESSRHRYVIMVLTDAPAHPLKETCHAVNSDQPSAHDMPGSLDELHVEYAGVMGGRGQRMILCAPMHEYPWNMLGLWNEVYSFEMSCLFDEHELSGMFKDFLGSAIEGL